MSYVALYRKFRPSTFDEVRGQEAIVTTLKNQVKTGRVQHAYLFCGTRGTGKTSVAKILARSVNCEHPVDGSPCGECAVCRQIASGSSMNVIEIDAASNNGVDNIRDIIEEVQYRPPTGRYKVYIIDEVHMLSTGAFNALLKTLEEPPEYVIFILATTEFAKIPLTILSRCQRYDFHRIDTPTIAGRLRELTEKEGHEAEEKALAYIARAADGSMRDALSLLDQCLAFLTGDVLTYDKVLEILGAADTAVYRELLLDLTEGDVPAALRILDTMLDSGREIGQFVSDFIWYLRNLLMVSSTAPGEEIPVDASDEQLTEWRETTAYVDQNTLMRYIRVLSELTSQLRQASNRRVLTEVAVIRLAKPQMEVRQDAVLDRLRRLEERLERLEKNGVVATAAGTGPAAADTGASPAAADGTEEETADPPTPPAPEDLQKIRREWPSILDEMKRKFPGECGLIRSQAALKFAPGSSKPELYIEFNKDLAYDDVIRSDFAKGLTACLRRRYRIEVPVTIIKSGENHVPLAALSLEEQLGRIHMPIDIEEEN
ncbi:MAG: DNA polymerase III subunit gamma/tau [Lachnospiraceae bacterium]|nr:DNA polymerase III subunit gamma/tau [Lachnospiraceae bacterium]